MTRLKSAVDTLAELAAIYAVLLTTCAGIFALSEGRGFLEALYWAGTTATSTGYGDISPQTAVGRFTAFVLMHVSIFLIAPLVVVRMVDRLNENRDAFTHDEQEEIKALLRAVQERLDK